MRLNPPQLRSTKPLPSRATRRNAARAMGVLAGWRDPKNRFVTADGNHVVVWPHTQRRA